jgi:tetratricopeptide (TPR) repeat protein
LGRLGRFEEAAVVLEEGLALARSLPNPYAEARLLEQRGERDEALAIFQRLGATADVERIGVATHESR